MENSLFIILVHLYNLEAAFKPQFFLLKSYFVHEILLGVRGGSI